MTAFDEALRAGLDWSEAHEYSNYVGKKQRVKKTGRTARKDSTRSKVYQAEWAFQDRFDTDVLSDVECYKLVGRVTKSKLWKELADGKEILVSFMKDMGDKAAIAGRAYGREIKLSPRHATKYTILHELTHCAGHMHHDVTFRQTVIKLVSRFMGREAAKSLKDEFRKAGLKMSTKSKILTPQEWIAVKEKMSKLREKKVALQG